MSNMKKTRKGTVASLVIWSVVLVLLVGAFVLAMIFGDNLNGGFPVLSLGGCGVTMPYNMDGYTSGNTDIAEPVRSLEIHWISGRVSVTVSPDTQVLTVREQTGAGEGSDANTLPLYWKLDNGSLFIRYCKAGLSMQSIEGKQLDVVIPAAWLAADGALPDGLGGISVDAPSGNVYVNVPAARTVDIDTASGTLEVHGRFKDVNLDTASGSVTVYGGADRASIDTASGRVTVYGAYRDLSATTASGRVELYLTAQPEDISVDSASGSVTIGLPGDMSGFDLDVDTASGRVTVDDFATVGTRKECVYGDGRTEIEVDTASGGVRIFRYDGNGEGRTE